VSEIDDRLMSLRRHLEAVGLEDWSDRFEDAVGSGSTGGEIMGRLRWEVSRLLETETPSGPELRAEAEAIDKLFRSRRS